MSDRDVTNMALVGGHPALDLSNTLSGRRGIDPEERLKDFGDAVTWGRRMGLLTEQAARGLRQRAERQPDDAHRDLERIRQLREVIHEVFGALAEGRTPDDAAVEALAGSLREAERTRRLVWSGRGAAWDWSPEGPDAIALIGPIADAAVALLFSPELERVKACGADDCQWLFLDTSRNQSRRWCDMADCGNRAKARRHYRKARESR